jgi:hypothetical protein
MISSSAFDLSLLLSVLTRPEHIIIIQVSQFLLDDRCVGFQSLQASYLRRQSFCLTSMTPTYLLYGQAPLLRCPPALIQRTSTSSLPLDLGMLEAAGGMSTLSLDHFDTVLT